MAACNEDVPSAREIADLTRRLRELSHAGRHVDPGDRAAFLADKAALITRIEAATRRAGTAEEAPAATAGVDRRASSAEHFATSDDDGEEWSR